MKASSVTDVDTSAGSRSAPSDGGTTLNEGSYKQSEGWLGMSWIMLADVVGTSVLTFAGVAKMLGWVPTGLLIVGLAPASIFSAILMSRTHSIIRRIHGVNARSMGEIARYAFKSGDSTADSAAIAVYIAVYGFAYLGNAAYLITLGEAFQGSFYNQGFCLPTAIVLTCLVLAPVVVARRRLVDSTWLCFANLFLILAVLAIVMTQMYFTGQRQDAQRFLFAEHLDFVTLFGASTNVLYSYTGHWMYFELMADMDKPEDFPKALWLNAPLQVGLYLLVAFWGYYYSGDLAEGYFLKNITDGMVYQVASLLLFFHVLVAFLIKNIVISRYLHSCLSPSRVDTFYRQDGGKRAHVEYAGCTLGVLLTGGTIAICMPFFSEFQGLVGGLLSGPVSFLLPMMFYIGAQQQNKRASSLLKPEDTESPSSATDERELRLDQSSQSKCVTLLEIIAFAVVGCFVIATMVFGTYSNVSDISRLLSQGGFGFGCKAFTLPVASTKVSV